MIVPNYDELNYDHDIIATSPVQFEVCYARRVVLMYIDYKSEYVTYIQHFSLDAEGQKITHLEFTWGHYFPVGKIQRKLVLNHAWNDFVKRSEDLLDL